MSIEPCDVKNQAKQAYDMIYIPHMLIVNRISFTLLIRLITSTPPHIKAQKNFKVLNSRNSLNMEAISFIPFFTNFRFTHVTAINKIRRHAEIIYNILVCIAILFGLAKKSTINTMPTTIMSRHLSIITVARENPYPFFIFLPTIKALTKSPNLKGRKKFNR